MSCGQFNEVDAMAIAQWRAARAISDEDTWQEGVDRVLLGQWLLFIQHNGLGLYRRPIGKEPELLSSAEVFEIRDRFIELLYPQNKVKE